MLSKNHWVRPFLVFFKLVREKLFVTVAFDHPVFDFLVKDVMGPSKQKKKNSLNCDVLYISFFPLQYIHY